MTDKQFKQLNDLLGTSKDAFKKLEGQIQGLDIIFESTIQSLEGGEKQKVKQLQAMTNRAINVAKKGGDYNAVLDNIKETFKVEDNGSNSNK